MLIGIAGAAGAGKDTMANYLVANHHYIKDSFAWPIYNGVNAMFGWTMDQWQDREWKEAIVPGFSFTRRQLLQNLGTQWRESMGDPMLWAKLLEKRCGPELLQTTVIADVRFAPEQDWIKANGGVVIEILRSDLQKISASDHKSENSLDNSKVDYVFANEGPIDMLDRRFQHFFQAILKV